MVSRLTTNGQSTPTETGPDTGNDRPPPGAVEKCHVAIIPDETWAKLTELTKQIVGHDDLEAVDIVAGEVVALGLSLLHAPFGAERRRDLAVYVRGRLGLPKERIPPKKRPAKAANKTKKRSE